MDIKDYFPDYNGPTQDYDAGVTFFAKKFLDRNLSASTHKIYHHVTCATDTRNIHVVFMACRDIILRENIRNSHLILE